MLLIFASVLKYALLNLQSTSWLAGNVKILTICEFGLGYSAGLLFMFAVLSASRGIEWINDLLEAQVTNIPDLAPRFWTRGKVKEDQSSNKD